MENRDLHRPPRLLGRCNRMPRGLQIATAGWNVQRKTHFTHAQLVLELGKRHLGRVKSHVVLQRDALWRCLSCRGHLHNAGNLRSLGSGKVAPVRRHTRTAILFATVTGFTAVAFAVATLRARPAIEGTRLTGFQELGFTYLVATANPAVQPAGLAVLIAQALPIATKRSTARTRGDEHAVLKHDVQLLHVLIC